MTESVENLLVLMRLAHVYDAESTLKNCQKWDIVYIVLISNVGWTSSFSLQFWFIAIRLGDENYKIIN